EMFGHRLSVLALGLALLLAGGGAGFGQGPATNRPWAYLLLDGSTLTDDCPRCEPPTIEQPMRGTFQLRLLDSNPLSTRYALENISFTAGSTRIYRVSGTGTLQIGGEVAVLQQMSLQV